MDFDLRCSSCGYEVAAPSRPAECPMCRGRAWDVAPWRPFSRSSQLPQRLGAAVKSQRPLRSV